jgi:UDP-2,3-diacylglucosamine pyrophosphatase LpxH
MNTIIVSDLHIGTRFFHSQEFERFLERFPEDHDLILNGDVVDSPYAKMESSHQRILDMIKRLSFDRKVVWVRGNHDNGYTPENFGKAEFKRQHVIGNRLLITHGDDFDSIMPRSRVFMKAFRLMHGLRVKLGAQPVHVAEYAKKWRAFYRILRNNVMRNAVNFALENGYKAVTCGHTHYAEDTVLNGIRYINTGAWTEFPAFFLQISPTAIILNRFDDSLWDQRAESDCLKNAGNSIRLNGVPLGPLRTPQDSCEISSSAPVVKLDSH